MCEWRNKYRNWAKKKAALEAKSIIIACTSVTFDIKAAFTAGCKSLPHTINSLAQYHIGWENRTSNNVL